MKCLNINNDELHAKIKSEANLKGITIASFSEELLEFALENYEVPTVDVPVKKSTSSILRPPFKKGGLVEKIYSAFGGELKPIKHRRNSRNPNREYIFPNYAKLYSGKFELTEDNKIIQIRKSRGKVYFRRSIFDVLYVHHVLSSSDKFLVKHYKMLLKRFKTDSSNQSMVNFIFNVKEGTFDEIIEEFRSRVSTARVNIEIIDNHRRITINGKPSKINPSLARDIHELMSNCNDPWECIWGLVHTYQSINCADIFTVAVNYTQLRFNEPEIRFVENNPTKRRNIIRNAGGYMSSGRIGGGGLTFPILSS